MNNYMNIIINNRKLLEAHVRTTRAIVDRSGALLRDPGYNGSKPSRHGDAGAELKERGNERQERRRDSISGCQTGYVSG